MGRKKTSPIWQISTVELTGVVENSLTYKKVLEHFGFSSRGGHYKTLNARLLADKISTSHFDPTGSRHKGLREYTTKECIPWDKVLTENSPYKMTTIRKKRLIKDGLLKNRCQVCNSPPVWMDVKLTLILDHINGTSTDNRLINLRLVCPNCNSQLDTHCGKNKKRKPPNRCELCKTPINRSSEHCKRCVDRTKIDWPDPEILKQKVESVGLSAVSRELNISDKSVKKRIIKYFPEWKSSYFKNKSL